MRFTQAAISAILAATAADARTFAVLRFNSKGLTTGRMDPIVNPGVPSGHSHAIQGGNAFALDMTDDDPLKSTCTTANIQNDKSNYWTPTLFFQDPKTGMLESVELFYMNVYYFFENDNDKVHAFPKGLRMLSGNSNARTPPKSATNILDTSQGDIQPIQWTCPRSEPGNSFPANSNGMNGVGIQDPGNGGAGVGFPDKECDGYASPLRADIHFPSCYDTSKGVRDFKNNMQWPTNNKCPAGTIRVPHLFYEVYWDTLKFKGRWTPGQGSSPWVLSNGDHTGYSLHGDFLNGWDTNTLQTIIDTCDAGSSGMTNCPNIPGGVNTANTCSIPNLVPEVVTGTMAKLPGNNPVLPWGQQLPTSPTTSAAGPYVPPAATTTKAAAAATTTTKAAVTTTTTTTLKVVTTTKAAAAVTTSKAVYSSNGGIVTSIVEETETVYTTITVPAPGSTPKPISGYTYKGCFSDNTSSRVLTGITFANIGQKQVTSIKCVEYCSARGYSIAGTEFGGQCFCGNELKGSKQIISTKCNMPCEGNAKETCGGPDALSVWQKKKTTKRERHLHRHAHAPSF